jgi:CspA family cold shock protein
MVVEHGTVAWFNFAKGFGFIRRDGGGDVFAHQSNIAFGKPGHRTLERDARVQFEVGEHGGKPTALNIQLETEAAVASKSGGNDEQV